jgi:Holliday junction resolvase RusA-like endonuclease
VKISFIIPGRPAGKERPRFDSEHGRVYTPKDTVAAERAIALSYRAAAGPGSRPATGPIKLTIIAVFPIPPSWKKALREEAATGRVWHVARGQLDLDNAVKLISDALNKVAFADDAQVAVITAGKRHGSPERMEITVETLPQAEAGITPSQAALEHRVATEGWDKVLAPAPKRAKRSKPSSRPSGFGRRFRPGGAVR